MQLNLGVQALTTLIRVSIAVRCLVIAVCVSLAASGCNARVTESPTESLDGLHAAIAAGDTIRIASYVDFPATARQLAQATLDVAARTVPGLSGDVGQLAMAHAKEELPRYAAMLERVLREQLGFVDARPADPEGPVDVSSALEYEFLGYGAVRHRGDTAVVERRLRVVDLDSVVSLSLRLVAAGRSHWRVVGIDSFAELSRAVHERLQRAVVDTNRAIARARDAYLEVQPLSISREPLPEFERYEVRIVARLRNRTSVPIRVSDIRIDTSGLMLKDSSAVLLSDGEQVIPPGHEVSLERRTPLRGAASWVWALLDRPPSAPWIGHAVVGDGPGKMTFELFRDWSDYRRRIPRRRKAPGPTLIAVQQVVARTI